MLKKDIDTRKNKIILTFGGFPIKEKYIAKLKNNMKYYGLENKILEVKQGFSLSQNRDDNIDFSQINIALKKK